MSGDQEQRTNVGRVAVATDRSPSAERAVRWAAALANLYGAPFLLIQVVLPLNPAATQAGQAEATRSATLADELRKQARELAGARGEARVVVDDDPARGILRATEEENVDTLIVGNSGMQERTGFLLGNVPNRISHNARCTVIIVNTTLMDDDAKPIPATPGASTEVVEEPAPKLLGRATEIGAVMARHGIKHLFAPDGSDPQATQRDQAKRLREALEELGPTFSKLGQILSTRADLLPPAFIEELAQLQDHVRPITEAEVVQVMEQALGVPWEDVFATIDPEPLAAGTIAQVHRATLSGGARVVVKVQRPGAKNDILRDLGLLQLFAEKSERRPGLRQMVDLPAVVEHLSTSLERELDFHVEASNIDRMRGILADYPALGVPEVYHELSSETLLVMQEIGGVGLREAPHNETTKRAARQFLESYYKQLLTEGFFHADPHPGNLKWWNDTLYFLDFGMVGEIGPDVRENLMMLLLAFSQRDVGFLTDVSLSLAGAGNRPDVDVEGFREALVVLMALNQGLSLKEMQFGTILQEMTEISLRYEVPLPSSLTMTGKAMGQMQLATAELDPDIDPFEVVSSYLLRQVTANVRGQMNPQRLFYETQKFKVRLTRLVESFERLTGARAGPKLQVNFRAERLEATVARSGRLLAFAIIAGPALLGAGTAASLRRAAPWVPVSLGGVGAAFVGLMLRDLLAGRRRS
jgi:predicted unusual protein kinase regulating ubiquinone biosynthesis (AarF/ABC1/UbiB family)/nucleotide-binding universal stress UspA family protein